MADHRQIKGEKSKNTKKRTRPTPSGSDSQEDRPSSRSRNTSGGISEGREDPANRSTAMDPAIAAQIRLMAQETVAAMMTAWRQRRNPDMTSDEDEDVNVGGAREPRAPAAPRFENPDYDKATQNFKRRIPTFEIGQTEFETFRLDFRLCADQSGFHEIPADHPRREALSASRNECLKGLMYQCLMPKAKRLAGRRLYPTSDECKPLTIKDYCTKLQAIFQSPAETETARQEFLARVQQKDESPMLYLSDKITLFERAFAQPKRDLNLLFDTTTDGLYNESLRMEMRKMVFIDEEEYGQKLAFFINAIRKSVVAGDLSEAEAKGTLTYSTTSSYLASQSESHVTIKSEPGIHAIDDRKRSRTTKKLLCYYCQKPGHFARECSRKLAGLPAAKRDFGGVQAVLVGDYSESSDSEYYPEEEISSLRNRRKVSFKGVNRGPRNKPRRYDRRGVSQMSPDASGGETEQFEDCDTSPEQEGQRDERPRDQSRADSGGNGGKSQTPPAARTIQSIQEPANTVATEYVDPAQTLEDEEILDLLTDQDRFLDL